MVGLKKPKKGSSDSEFAEKEEGVVEATAKVGFDVEAKVEKIKASKLSDAEKDAYIRKLKSKAAAQSEKISFAVYAQKKSIKPHMREPMQAYPAAKGVKSAPFEVWEDIFKNF